MRIPTCLAVIVLALSSAPVAAQAYVQQQSTGEWVDVSAGRYVPAVLVRAQTEALAVYGPFRVLDEHRVALVGVTDSHSPAEFAALLHDFPHIETIEFVECPGTHDDRANLRLGRMIRAHGLAAIVPEGGSVRSGAVELFLAGATRQVADDAEFAVHAWLDDRGFGAWDYAPDSAEHQKYLAYYREMGMEAHEAQRFYAMTNSVPFESALWLTGEEMRGWIGEPQHERAPPALPRLAYLDLSAMLN